MENKKHLALFLLQIQSKECNFNWKQSTSKFKQLLQPSLPSLSACSLGGPWDGREHLPCRHKPTQTTSLHSLWKSSSQSCAETPETALMRQGWLQAVTCVWREARLTDRQTRLPAETRWASSSIPDRLGSHRASPGMCHRAAGQPARPELRDSPRFFASQAGAALLLLLPKCRKSPAAPRGTELHCSFCSH